MRRCSALGRGLLGRLLGRGLLGHRLGGLASEAILLRLGIPSIVVAALHVACLHRHLLHAARGSRLCGALGEDGRGGKAGDQEGRGRDVHKLLHGGTPRYAGGLRSALASERHREAGARPARSLPP